MSVLNTYQLMWGIEKYVLSGAVAGLTAVAWHDKPDAFTDGGTIHLPRPNAKMTERELLLWRYKAEHELGHEDAVNSCPHWKEVMVEKRKDPKYKDDGLLWMISNIISDHVQERNRVGEMIGRDELLLKGRATFLDDMVWPQFAGKKDSNPEEARGAGIFIWETNFRLPWNSNIKLPVINNDIKAVADMIAAKSGVNLDLVKNEADVFDAAVKVRSLFPEVPPSNGNPPPSEGEGDGSGNPADGKMVDAKEGKGKAKKKSDKSIQFTPSAAHGERTHKHEDYSYATHKGANYTPRIPVGLGHKNRHGGYGGGSHRSAVESRLRRTNLPAKVRAWLMAMKREKWTTGYRTGRLDTNRLTDVLRNKEDLFRRKETTRLVDSAVYLLVDSSGSMSGGPFQNACAAAVMMAESLQGIGVNIEIAGFTEFSDRKDGCIHDIWTPFGQRFVKEFVLNKMDKMSMNLSNNADGENIMYAYARLKNQPQQRKILIVLSDGEPSAQGPAGCTMGIGQFTKETIEMIEKDKSVHIIGLGMSGYSPKRFYKHAYEVKANQPLEQVLLDIVKNSVLK